MPLAAKRVIFVAGWGLIGLWAFFLAGGYMYVVDDPRDCPSTYYGEFERGILRSGIHARNVANVNTDIARQVGDATQQFQSQGGAIDTALARLQEQEAAEKASAEASIRSGLLQFEQGQTLANLLASLPLQPVQPPAPVMPAPPVLTPPLIGGPPGPWDIHGMSAGTNANRGNGQINQASIDAYLRQLVAV